MDEWIAPLIPGIPDVPCWEPEPSENAVVINTPGVTQVHTYSCGATASWSVLQGMGWDISLGRWINICHAAGMGRWSGMEAPTLDKALSEIGARLRTVTFQSRYQIEDQIDAGHPVLFEWDNDGYGHGDHWMYVYGYQHKKLLVGNIVEMGSSKAKVRFTEWESRLFPRVIHVIVRGQ